MIKDFKDYKNNQKMKEDDLDPQGTTGSLEIEDDENVSPDELHELLTYIIETSDQEELNDLADEMLEFCDSDDERDMYEVHNNQNDDYIARIVMGSMNTMAEAKYIKNDQNDDYVAKTVKTIKNMLGEMDLGSNDDFEGELVKVIKEVTGINNDDFIAKIVLQEARARRFTGKKKGNRKFSGAGAKTTQKLKRDKVANKASNRKKRIANKAYKRKNKVATKKYQKSYSDAIRSGRHSSKKHRGGSK